MSLDPLLFHTRFRARNNGSRGHISAVCPVENQNAFWITHLCNHQKIVDGIHLRSTRGVQSGLGTMDNPDRSYIPVGFPVKHKDRVLEFAGRVHFVVDGINGNVVRSNVHQLGLWTLDHTDRRLFPLRATSEK